MSTETTIKVDVLEEPEEGAIWRRMPRSLTIRRRLKLTVEEFAERFRIPADLQRAWDAGTAKPDAVAEAFMLMIARDPDAVTKALAPREPRGEAGRQEAGLSLVL